MAFERTCIVDKVRYKYCNNCSDYNPNEKWRLLFCCDNCRQVYKVCEDFVGKKISAIDAQDTLDKLDISNKESFVLPIQHNITDIYAVEKPKKKYRKYDMQKEESPIVVEDEPVVTEIVNEIIDPIVDLF